MQNLESPPRYIVDAEGHRTDVILSMGTYCQMLAAMEELEDIHDFDEAKASATELISADELRRRVLES